MLFRKRIALLVVLSCFLCPVMGQANSDPPNLNGVGFELYRKGQYQRAIELFKKAAEVSKEDLGVIYNNLGSSYYALRDYEQAAFYFEKALEEDPGRTKTLVNLAAANFRQGHYLRAVGIVRRAEKTDPFYVRNRLHSEKVDKEIQDARTRDPENGVLAKLAGLIQEVGEKRKGNASERVLDASVEEVVRSIGANLEQVRTFSSRIIRVTKGPKGSSRQEWKAQVELPHKLRVEWMGQEPMTFVCSETEAWYFMPRDKEAVHITDVDTETLPELDLGLNVLPEYVVSHRLSLSKQSPEGQWLLEGEPYEESEKVGLIRLWFGQSSRCLLESELYDREGRLRVRTEYSKFVQFAEKLTLPTRCRMINYSEVGKTTVEMRFLEMKVNVPWEAEVFALELPDGVQVTEK